MNTGTTQLTPLLGMTLGQLQEVVAALGMPRFSAGQICRWLYVKCATSIDEMTDLSKTARAKLATLYTVGRYEHIHSASSTDGTVKYLFPTGNDGKAVESVYIPDDDRATLCISTQRGCKMGCRFCMTGKQGYHGSLTAHEIVYKSCMKAYEQEVPLKQILMQTPEVTQAFTEEEVDLMLNPHSYIGLAPEFVDRVVAKWENI